MSEVCHIPQFLNETDSQHYFDRLKAEIPWAIHKWGRFNLKRETYRHDCPLRAPVLEELKFLVEAMLETRVSGIWCNHYRDGKDETGYHHDNYGAYVFSLSLGAPRDFLFKHVDTKVVTKYCLRDGDGFWFSPAHDKTHKHNVPKRMRCKDPRISIVFFIDKPGSKI